MYGGLRVKLNYGSRTIEFQPTGNYEVIMPEELSGAENERVEIERALEGPVGAQFSDFEGCKKASILVSDITRPSPSYKLLPPLLDKLHDLGVPETKIVFALGTHRCMTPKEERTLLGDCFNKPHIQHDKERCVHLGQTKAGTPVEIFEEVASSDLIIATGNIEYHYYAGYSGGAKAILPGVSSERSVTKNHSMMADPGARSGILDGPVRQDMEDAAGIADLDFILNVVLNSQKEIVKAVAGDFVKAHRMGARVVDEMYGRAVEPAEIVVTCAGGRPKDINLFQAQKALDNAKDAVVTGGTIILVAECPEGLGNAVFDRWVREAKSPEDCFERFGREYEFGGHKAGLIAKEALDHQLILVSSMDRKTTEMCFFEPASTLDEAVAKARALHGKDSRMLIMPYGGLTLATPA
jgi:nickel-dependent lactate racemase